MQVGAFRLNEPLPDLREPHLVMVLRPWVDVGSVGTLSVGLLEQRCDARDLGQLERPSVFYDLTRYRPMLHRREGRREITLPNSYLRYVRREIGPDLVFLHALEPHGQGELFVESVAEVMDVLGIRRFCMVGAMYAPAPHTRPLMASGVASSPEAQSELRRLGVRSSTYEGPTSVVALVTEEALRRGMESLTTLIQLPTYAQLEEDYMGQHALLRLLEGLYGFTLDLEGVRSQGERQYRRLDQLVQADPRLREAIQRLEAAYDSPEEETGEPPTLAPEIERFLQDIEGQDEGA